MASPKTSAYMISCATLMVEPYSSETSVFDLTPDDHSVGMVKDVAVTMDASNIDLTNCIAQVIVDTVRANTQVNITGSIYEYTAQNILRALGLSGQATAPARGVLGAEAAGGAVSLTVQSDPVPGDASTAIPAAAGAIPAGATLIIQHPDNPELVFTTRSTGASTYLDPDHTVAIAAPYTIPVGMTFPVGSHVWVATEAEVGSMLDADLFKVKIAGTLSKFQRPVVVLAPKVQITRGFNLSYTESDYGSMPWEMRPMVLTTGEATGRLAEIGTKAPCRIFLP